MKTRFIFQLAYSSSVSQVAEAYSGSSGCKVDTQQGQDALPSQGAPRPPSHSLGLGQVRHTHSPHGHVFGVWEEPKDPEKNHAETGDVQIPQGQGLWPWKLIFSPTNIIKT